tara:strand:+ start:126 stop:554 length:429 start_codon:yes stop_codon:yes gene_type:complete
MINFSKTSREDYTEYAVSTDEYVGGSGDEQLVGYVTKFGDKKWAFRTIGSFFSDVMPTDKFDSRKDAVFSAIESLRFIQTEKPVQNTEQEIDLSAFQQYRPVNNSRKRTRGRKIQYIQRARRLENGELEYLNSYKKIHHERV